MNKFQNPVPDCVIFFLAKAYQKAHAHFKKQLQPYGLTNIQHLVLEGLWYAPGQTAAELGEFLILDKATLSGVLDRMDKAGWIRKEADPEDGRIFKLYPSERANALKEELIALRQRTNEEILSPFSLEEQVLLKRLLKDLS
ncbi:MAG: MarR family transcriptional regulator [Deltaproteobacteria bacterium]|nr:MarR family transcriptional regulator [Deltaproteobacteria bacterium]